MADAPTIRIPDEIRPADGRFGCGPSKVRPAAVSALADVATSYLGTSHRQKTVRDQVARLRRGLAEFYSLPEGYEVVLGNGGTTAFWEVATFGLIRDRAQFASFGEFGAKFAKSVKDAPFLGEPTVRKSDAGSAPTLVAEAGVDVYATPHNETSTGVAVPISRVAGADEGSLLLVDATSGAGGLDVDVAQTDVYYFAPQKCFGSDGGLWLALMSPAALARATEIKESGRYIPAFLDLVTAIDNSRLEQTYNTPALATIFLAAEQTDWMNSPGRAGLGGQAHRRERRHRVRLGRALVVRHAVRVGPGAAVQRGRHCRLRRRGGRHGDRQGAARERHRRHRAVPQAGPQPAAGGALPGRRAGRRRGAHRVDRLRGRATLITLVTVRGRQGSGGHPP